MATWLAPVRGGFTIISDEDRHLLKHRWSLVPKKAKGGGYYVAAWIGGKTQYLHRLIMDAAKGQEVDHIDGDGLNNARSNLRFASRAENCRNSKKPATRSGYRGVYRGSENSWQVKLTADRKHIRGGSYVTPEDAARAYDRLAREYHGAFATLNFPQEMV